MSVGDAHTILVVDDDDALAEMIGLVLAQEGFNAVFCENGARAFETFMRSTPDLVLLDPAIRWYEGAETAMAYDSMGATAEDAVRQAFTQQGEDAAAEAFLAALQAEG